MFSCFSLFFHLWGVITDLTILELFCVRLDHATSGGANIGWVPSFTITNDVKSLGSRDTHAAVVFLGPWGANLSSFFFGIVHGALVTLGQQPTQSVDLINWVRSSFSNVFVEVTPASVSVNFVQVQLTNQGWVESFELGELVESVVPVVWKGGFHVFEVGQAYRGEGG